MCGDAKASSKGYLDVRCVRPAVKPLGGVVLVPCVDEVNLRVRIGGELCAVVSYVIRSVVVWYVTARGSCECVLKRVK